MFFADAAEFRAWLEVHHDSAIELWMGLYGRHVTPRGLTWDAAVLEALCFGWIDSVSQRIDDDARRQRWTPRKPGSNWSRVNIAHVARLTAEGRMHPAGLAAFERRRPDTTAPYSHEAAVELSAEFRALVEADPRARAFLAVATPGYHRIVAHWVMSAKQEATRLRRATQLRDDSAAGRLVPPARPGTPPAWLTRAAAAAVAATDQPDDGATDQPGDTLQR